MTQAAQNMTTAQSTLPRYKAEMGPTPAATRFNEELIEAGYKTYNFGHGAEQESPEDVASEILSRKFGLLPTSEELRAYVKEILSLKPKYNQLGGAVSTKQATADWLKRFFGIEGTVGLFPTNGRAMLGHGWSWLAQLAREAMQPNPCVLVPNTRWPMIDAQTKRKGLALVDYQMGAEGLAEQIEEALTNSQGRTITAVYINSPHNPTGMIVTPEEMGRVMTVLEKFNTNEEWLKARGGVKVALCIDNPYFHALQRSANPRQGYLDAGLANVLRPDTATPWYAPFSFSKALASAERGVTAFIAHPETYLAFSKIINEDLGPAHDKHFFSEMMAKIFAPEFDEAVLEYFADLREKYIANHATLKRIFGDAVVQWDGSMTCLVEVSDDMFGRQVTGKTGTRIIKDLNDFIEFAGQEEGIVVVNNTMKTGPSYLRFAFATQPDRFAEGAEKLDGLYKLVMGSPKI
ncbi:MAG: aminotransferase class I/II-fold pyridoxal phosphate-dependent enzyme [Alphaproteobacteria bacterium]|nr:aminotransferase class I/II-fold pyridoxal phosphate-dependent enzyme [Alphaproteobacteria bacterium]